MRNTEQATMTGLERIRAAVAHREPDVVPWHPYVSPGHALHLLGHETHEMFTVPGLLPKAMIHACEHYGCDMVYVRPDECLGDRYEIEERSEDVLFRDRASGDPVHRVQRDGHNLIPLYDRKTEGAYIRDISEVDAQMPIVSASELLVTQPYARAMRQYKEACGDRVAVFGGHGGVTIKALRWHRGFEQGLMDLWLNPELAEAIMWRRVEQLREWAKACAQIGLHGYYTGDAEASCSVVSPGIFHDRLMPIYKAHINDLHDQGLIALLHICGKSDGILEDVAQTRADIFESLDPPSLGGDVDLADAKRRIGETVCLKGNLDAPGVIAPGPARAVYDQCMTCMSAAARGGGYILSTEQVTPHTPSEHVFAMERARRDFRLP